MYERQENMKQG